MKKSPLLIIEHCEENLSRWLNLEYKHVVKIWGKDVVFTNVKDKKTFNAIGKIGQVNRKNAKQFLNGKKCIVLDPQAKNTLTPIDCSEITAIVIGGILGAKKPLGKTKKFISEKYDFETRNIGKIQLSIDGAAFVAKAISLGLSLKDIEISYEVEIKHDSIHSTILPYGYPIINKNPVITPGLVEYLRKY